MALTICPECTREVSDTIPACPHCGFVFATVAEQQVAATITQEVKPIKRFKIKKILLLGLGIVFVLAIVALIVVASNSHKAKLARTEYIDNLSKVSTIMLGGGTEAETLCNLTRQVWYDSIYKDFNKETAKYTIKESAYTEGKLFYPDSDYVGDFNVALGRLFAAEETKAAVKSIEKNQAEVRKLMQVLNSPPKDLERCYETLENLYITYQGLTDLAIDPTGSLTSFTENKNKKIETFLDYYRRLENQIPSKNK